MAKATHKGECQICGRVQKLPGGLLSKHGYTVQWQMFQGTCPGSHELPYEQSCNLIKSRLPIVQRQLTCLEQSKALLLQQATEPIAWLRVYYKSTHSYGWAKAELTEVRGRNKDSGYEWMEIQANYLDGGELAFTTVPNWKGTKETVLEAAARLNKAYAEHELTQTIKHTESYLRWCQGRIQRWEAKGLQIL